MTAAGGGRRRPSVLIVDDEPNLLEALQRTLRSSFSIRTAQSGDAAIEAVRRHAPIDVVVCDMNMPGKSGVDTLSEIATASPDTVRIMLTGQANAETAMRAVNEGRIFRFLAKPCTLKVLTEAITAGAEQHRLITAERELLNKTLSGGVKLLTDIIAIYDPHGFSRKDEIRSAAEAAAATLDAPDYAWKIEMAMLLAPIGRAALPADICAKINDGEPLTKVETDVYHASVEVAYKLIRHIPRLEEVAEAVRHQFKDFDGGGWPVNGAKGEEIPELSRIARILNAALDQRQKFEDAETTMKALRGMERILDQTLLDRLELGVLQILSSDDSRSAEIAVAPTELAAGDRLLTPIVDQDTGELLLAAGSQITEVLIDRIRNLERVRRVNPSVRARRPSASPAMSAVA